MKQLIVTIEGKKWLSPLRSARFAEMSLSELQKQNVAQESAGLKNAGTKRKCHISQERLMEVLDYNPDTGYFTWIVRLGARTQIGGKPGTVDAGGYLKIAVDGKAFMAHRLAWIYFYGGDISNSEIDHINGNRLDNRISNLRLANRSENNWNQKIKNSNNSGVKGVSWDKGAKKWRAQCMVNGVKYFIGRFNNISDAEQAVVSFRRKFHGKFVNNG